MMEDGNNPRFAQLVAAIAPGGALLRSWPLSGGISAAMTALEIGLPEGGTRRLIVRQPGAAALARDPDAALKEFRTLQLTRALGLATQEPIYLDHESAIFATPALAIGYIDGGITFAPVDLEGYAAQLADQLARIHGAPLASHDVAFLPRHGGECAEGALTPQGALNDSLDERRIRGALERFPRPRQRNGPALLHGDYWPGNMLWRDGKLAAVIDWEDAQLGDPLVDLAIARLELSWIFGAEALRSFTARYQSLMALDYGALPYWDLCAALRFIRLAGADLAGWAAFFPPFGRPDITEQSIRADYRRFVAEAFESLHAPDP
jgi:aminoglycoside phosphotransferase (APT) family kinase protein